MKADIQTLGAETAGTLDLPDAIFGLEPRQDILHRMIMWQLAKRQAGTHKAKTRGEVNRTTKKLGNQKGSGGARHGSQRANLFRGGGRSFGPHPRDHAIDLPKKVRALALRHALSAKAKDGNIVVIDALSVKDAKTKALAAQFGKLELANALFIGGDTIEENFGRAARNIPNVDVLPIQGINVYDILRRQKLVLTKAAVEALEARFK